MHQVFADLCPFERFCKRFAAYCLEVIVCKFYFIIGIFFANNKSMSKILIFFFFFLHLGPLGYSSPNISRDIPQ